jgi:hypothetical protein
MGKQCLNFEQFLHMHHEIFDRHTLDRFQADLSKRCGALVGNK